MKTSIFILVGIALYLLLPSCIRYIPQKSSTYKLTYETQSPYEKQKAKELQREQLRYYRNQNNK